jgi:hypothetical protein
MKSNYFNKFIKVNRIRFTFLFAFIFALVVFSFLAAWSKDEGTLGSDIITNFAADAFYILRFPVLICLDWLLRDRESVLASWISFLSFIPSLILTAGFYSFLIEALLNCLRLLSK